MPYRGRKIEFILFFIITVISFHFEVQGIQKQKSLLVKAEPKKREKHKTGIWYKVEEGVSLWQIAKAYNIPMKQLQEVNGIKEPSKIKVGQKIFIPKANKLIEIKPCLNEPVEFLRIRNNESVKISLTYCNGKVYEKGRKELSFLARDLPSNKVKLLNPRLIQLLQKIANHYKGKRIEIISGYRGPKPGHEKSHHVKGKAIDFRIAGISNKELFYYLKKFKNVGTGYYPNSIFVHLDVREKNGIWVDWSGPGEPPRYGSLDHDPLKVSQSEGQQKENREEGGLPTTVNSSKFSMR